MSQAFREELIQSVHPNGRDEYRRTLDEVPDAVGHQSCIATLSLRIIKGFRQTYFDQVMVTTNGLATPDGRITDCSAAVVRKKNGRWERFSGKDTKNLRGMSAQYHESEREFTLSNEEKSRRFRASLLQPHDGEVVQVAFEDSTVEGVLESGEVREFIRECLRYVESDTEDIDVLLRHTSFHRPSDTQTSPVEDVNTLFTDGAQIHVMNRNTLNWQNKTISRKMAMMSYRPGIVIEGANMPANIEDVVYATHIHTRKQTAVPLFFTSLTPRCKVTQRDLASGEIQAEPKSWLLKRRPIDEKKRPTMGANADMPPTAAGSIISVGDRITVLSEKTGWSK